MEKQQIIEGENGIIKYEFRHNCVLLIFTNFTDQRLTLFADKLETECSEIQKVDTIKRYDEVSAAIIVKMKVGYWEHVANAEIKLVFDNIFNKINQV